MVLRIKIPGTTEINDKSQYETGKESLKNFFKKKST